MGLACHIQDNALSMFLATCAEIDSQRLAAQVAKGP